MPFIANQGQLDKSVRYYAHTFGGTVFVTDKGVQRIFLTTKSPVRNDLDRITHVVTVSLDITDRKRAEEELNRTMAELARSNAELEQFAYVASHDLQEPLRKIQAFGDRLEAKYGQALDKRGRDYLARMQNAAGRMQTLINDLLRILVDSGRLIPVNPEVYLAPEEESRLRSGALSVLERISPASPADFGDELGLSRRVLIPLLEYLDRVSVTRRTPQGRVRGDSQST